MKKKKIVLVSALLPVSVREEKKSQYSVKVSPGGLITTLSQSVENSKVIWLGWYGYPKYSKKIEEMVIKAGKEKGFNLLPISLSFEEFENFFNNFSNGVIWPLFHTFSQYCRFEEEYWNYYVKVNEKFASKIISFLKENPDYVVWVHDYHFLILPEFVKAKIPDAKMYFFLHIPFPSFENFLKLPWRKKIIDGLLGYDFIGFHTKVDKNNFIQCVNHFYDLKVNEKSYVSNIKISNKTIKVSALPISIDFEKYNQLAYDKEVLEITEVLKDRYKDKYLILSIDRIDYTKGLVEKLEGIKRFIEKYPEYRERFVMLVSTAPNIKKLPEYTQLEQLFHHKIAEINGTYGTEEWRPILFINKRLDFKELIAYYRVSDICFINSIKDGLNIVCKEYASSNVDLTGSIMLSEFAGASTEIGKYVYLVNPYDKENIADTIKYIFEEDKKIKSKKISNLRNHISQFNIHWWSDSFFRLAEGKKLDKYPELLDFYPVHEQ